MVEQKQIAVNPIPRPVGPRVGGAVPGLTPKDISSIIRRHLFMLISLTLLGSIAGGVSWFLLLKYAPKYTPRTFIEVLPALQQDPMEMRDILVNKDIQYDQRSSIVSLIKQQSTLQNLLNRDNIQETNWFRQFGQNMAERITGAYEDLEKHLRVDAQRDGNFVIISMTCGDKKEAALIVNEMVDLFVNSHGATERKEVIDELAALERRRVEVQRELKSVQDSLDVVRENLPTGYADLETRQWRDTSTLRLDNLQIKQDELLLDISRTQSIITIFEEQSIGPIREQVGRVVESDPIMIMLAQQIALREADIASKLTKFGESHREIRRTKELIREIESRRAARKQEIAEQVRQANLQNAQNSLTALMEELEELQNTIAEAASAKEEMDRARVLYEKQLNIRDERQVMLNSIKEQIEKQRMILEDPETAKVKKVGLAPEPMKVSSPRWEYYFPGGTILGFMLGLGLAFLVEILNDLVRTPRDVGRYLHIPLLGVIPDSSEDGQLEDVDLYHVVRRAPYSLISESYRRLRTDFQLSDSKRASKALLIASGMPGDGNTSVAVNLATAFTAELKKVLLIDANFRRPSLYKIFPKAHQQDKQTERPVMGLSNLLSGQNSSEEVIRPTGIEDFDVIDAGPLPSNPAEQLGSVQMQELIKQQRENYDYVIIDGPPVLLVSDTKMLVSATDGALLVFNADTTHRGAAQRTIRELRAVNVNMIGCVLFAVKSLKGGYFREQFKSYREYQKLQVAG
ncbi:polysaccharide biosynthesis tyrosine autokinase [Planctomycetota bacterium]